MTPEKAAYEHGFLAGMWYVAELRAVDGTQWDHRPFLVPRDPATFTPAFGQSLRASVELQIQMLRLPPDQAPPTGLDDALAACQRVVEETDERRAELLKSVVDSKIDQMGAELRDAGVVRQPEPGAYKPLPTDAEFGRGFCDGARLWCLQHLGE
jgi:hypothetical protein